MKMRNFMDNKKGDEASTLTWYFAVFIIFILVIGLLVGVFFWTGKSKFKFWDPDKITTQKTQLDANFVSGETLSFLMGMQIDYEGQETEVKELMKKWPSVFEDNDKNDALKKKLEQEIKPILDNILENSTGVGGYVFHAELEIVGKERKEIENKETDRLRRGYGLPSGIHVQTSNMLKGTLEVSELKAGECMANKDAMLNKRAAETYLISGEEKIEVKLYIGVC